MMIETHRVIVDLKGISRERAIQIAKECSGRVWGFKVHTLFTQYGPGILKILKPYGKIFLDMKFHDIPSVTAGHVRAARFHGADLISVHSDGADGLGRLQAAIAEGGSRIVAITELTSSPSSSKVTELAKRASDAGAVFIVTSPHEARMIKTRYPWITVITPGIRGPHDPMDDQVRTMTPQEARAAGADLFVIGRPILNAPQPMPKIESMLLQ